MYLFFLSEALDRAMLAGGVFFGGLFITGTEFQESQLYALFSVLIHYPKPHLPSSYGVDRVSRCRVNFWVR